MKQLGQAHESIVEMMRRKTARDAFAGCIAFLWTTHSAEEVREMLKAAILDCEDVL